MSDFLNDMAASSSERAAQSLSCGPIPCALLERPVHALRLSGFDLIAELKQRSPAEGTLVGRFPDRAAQARKYSAGGAAAISVLTEPSHFDGDLEHVTEVCEALDNDNPVPVMRKDFLVDPVQVLEARAAGASGVLLIASMLADSDLNSMLDCAFEHSMFVLLESFDANDVARSVRLLERSDYAERAGRAQLLLGINTRNLRTLKVDTERLQELIPQLPKSTINVAESGIKVPADAARARAMGYAMALVGTALMRDPDPASLIGAMLEAGRAAL